ncbi:malonyl-CoA:anthocyanidin 5-O-glucoside-6''-O-malonyltransferase-like, partial [Lotus japonicus]|uniref:malonyl-CoA:anthocyanidin 5-O-glucoside-6''-O-malonyltransferase-like n=1 Tax=Lotus japonicus TaxID=34305 RepID=UPI002586FDD9
YDRLLSYIYTSLTLLSQFQSVTEACLTLNFFDLFWLRFHPVETIFSYNLQNPESDPSFFFLKVVPKLKTSLSLTLQHFPPLAGNVVWPSESEKPLVKFTPGDDDGVSLIIAESNTDFNHILEYNTLHEAAESRSFIPHLESTDSSASVMSLQITLFPNRGFSIGISTHHAVLDGKSSTLFLKAWAYLCQTSEESESESPSLLPDFEPFFDRKIIKDREPAELGIPFAKNWTEVLSMMFPVEKSNEQTLKILPFPPKVEDSVRGRFLLTRGDGGGVANLGIW